MKSTDGRFEYQDKDGNPLPDGSTMAQVGRLSYQCRTDPTTRCSVNCGKNAGYQIESQNWELTGTLDQPTIAPSINCQDCWHGYIEKGVFVNQQKKREAVQ